MSHCCWMVFRTWQGPWIYSQVHFLLSHSKEMKHRQDSKCRKGTSTSSFLQGRGLYSETVCAGPQHAGPPGLASGDDYLLELYSNP